MENSIIFFWRLPLHSCTICYTPGGGQDWCSLQGQGVRPECMFVFIFGFFGSLYLIANFKKTPFGVLVVLFLRFPIMYYLISFKNQHCFHLQTCSDWRIELFRTINKQIGKHFLCCKGKDLMLAMKIRRARNGIKLFFHKIKYYPWCLLSLRE